MKQNFINELNKIARMEMNPEWYWICKFCGKKSTNGRWMFKHILGHLKQCIPICDECGIQHLPNYFDDYEETLDVHTITVKPENIFNGLRYLGFR